MDFFKLPEGIGDKTYETVKDLPILLYGENKEIITGKLRATGKWAWDNENNSAMSIQGRGWYILPAGTYTIVTNGVKIESIVCNLQK